MTLSIHDGRSVFLLTMSMVFAASAVVSAESPVSSSNENGYISWSNANPSLYYTVEYRPNLFGTSTWEGSYRAAQDIHSADPVITVPVGMFYRVTGSTTPRFVRALSPTSSLVQAGSYTSTNLAQVDPDLAASNIRGGVSLFGVTGLAAIVDSSSGDAGVADLASGRKAWVDGVEITGTAFPTAVPKTGAGDLPGYTVRVGEDGYPTMKKGAAWPVPRFTDNANGTVSDNLTGLVWLKNADAFGGRPWYIAIDDCRYLNSGEKGLSDGSVEGDWRLPSIQELASLLDFGFYGPPLPNTAGTGKWQEGDPFTGVQQFYWSGTTQAGSVNSAIYVQFYYGSTGYFPKGVDNTCLVWPVRDSR